MWFFPRPPRIFENHRLELLAAVAGDLDVSIARPEQLHLAAIALRMLEGRSRLAEVPTDYLPELGAFVRAIMV